jgi:hypothetical protein
MDGWIMTTAASSIGVIALPCFPVFILRTRFFQLNNENVTRWNAAMRLANVESRERPTFSADVRAIAPDRLESLLKDAT